VIKRIIIIAVNALCLIAFIICLSISASIQSALLSQNAANVWAGQSGERFSQLSVFFPASHHFDEQSLHEVRSSINSSLLQASLESTPHRVLHTDGWSTNAEVTVLYNRGQGRVNVNAIAVGGDFFLFNPLRLRDGSYLSSNDIMHDRVVIDEELAWRLFGAVHVAGFEIYINYRPFFVAGVVARENDFASERAYTYGAGLFMSFDMLMEMTHGEANISHYSIVLPDPVTGFAYDTVTEAISDSSVHIVENSTRFSLANSFSRIGAFGERSMRTDSIALPYWENAARIVEDWVALLLVFSLFFLAFPVICAIIYGIILIRFLLKLGKASLIKKIDERDKRKYKEYIYEHGLKDEVYDIDDNEYYDDDYDIDVDEIIREISDDN